jgi:hypothetical protein
VVFVNVPGSFDAARSPSVATPMEAVVFFEYWFPVKPLGNPEIVQAGPPIAAIHSVSSVPHDGVSDGGLAFVEEPVVFADSGGVVPCQFVIRIVRQPVGTELTVVTVIVEPSEPVAIL